MRVPIPTAVPEKTALTRRAESGGETIAQQHIQQRRLRAYVFSQSVSDLYCARNPAETLYSPERQAASRTIEQHDEAAHLGSNQ